MPRNFNAHFVQMTACLTAVAVLLSGCILRQPGEPDMFRAPAVTGVFEDFFPEGFFTPEEDTDSPLSGGADGDLPPIPAGGLHLDTPKNSKGEIKVGLLLPLTGAANALARDMQDAAMLAIYDSRITTDGGYHLALLPKDTSTSPSVAAAVAEQAIAQDAKVLIGPRYSQSVDMVKKVVVDKGVPILALSNNQEMKSEQCFIWGVTPESEVLRVVEHILKQGKLHLAVLVPNNAYGQKLEESLLSVVHAKGGQVVALERYVESTHGRKTAVKRLAVKLKATSAAALFLGDNKAESALMLNQLRHEGVNTASLTLVGTSQWDGHDSQHHAMLAGGVYASTSDRAFERFSRRFRAAMGRNPMRLSAIAYDAVSLVADIAGSGEIPTPANMHERKDIQGRAAGIYRLEADGRVVRGLSLYRLTADGKETLEHAPKQF